MVKREVVILLSSSEARKLRDYIDKYILHAQNAIDNYTDRITSDNIAITGPTVTYWKNVRAGLRWLRVNVMKDSTLESTDAPTDSR